MRTRMELPRPMTTISARTRVMRPVPDKMLDRHKPLSRIRTHVPQSKQFGLPMAQIDLPAEWRFAQDPNSGVSKATGLGVKVESSGNVMFTCRTLRTSRWP